MEIISIKFVSFAISSIIVFYLLKPKYRIRFLTILSCGFIASFSFYLLFYILLYTLFNYFIGIKISESKNRVLLFRIGLVVNLSQIILLKYASFAIDPFLQAFNCNIQISALSKIIIPVGISYFTLQGIGYLFNIKMGWEKPENNFLSFLLYVIFFPKFLSGPIERSNHFLPQLKLNQPINEIKVIEGLKIALLGFFKKIAIANQISPYLTDVYANLNSVDSSLLWTIIILQPLYLYFDFSGYTDIAIGFSKAFGFELLPNFDKPFLSENMTNFWKRFHISLSSWFNDFVFKQYSFKRRKWGVYASVYALLLTWMLFGIWHGAGWNFMMLGLVQALAIIFEFFSKRWRTVLFSKIPTYLGLWLGRIITFLFYGTSLTFFFSPDIQSSFVFFAKLIQSNPLEISVIKIITIIPLSAIIFIFCFSLFEIAQNDFQNFYKSIKSFWDGNETKKILLRWTVYASILSIIFVLGSDIKEFIYAQF